jgi:hypothetical protein
MIYNIFKKKEEKIQKEEKIKDKHEEMFSNRLTITFKNGSTWWCQHSPYDPSLGVILPWKQFYKWFHSRSQSSSFSIHTANGICSFSRDDISFVTSNIIKVEKVTS